MLEPSEPGTVRCMKCQKLFRSPDRQRIRRCRECKRKEAGTAGIREAQLPRDLDTRPWFYQEYR